MQLSGRLQALRLRLLAGAALAVLAPAGMVAAQTQPPVQQAGPDALSPDAVYVEADAAVRQGDTITATASDSERALVRARGYTLRGENLSYELAQGADRDKVTIEPVTGEEERRPAKPFADKPNHAPAPQRREREGGEARSFEKKPYERKSFGKPAGEGRAPYEGRQKSYEGKAKPFAERSYDPVRSDRDVSDPNVSFRSGPKPSGEKKPFTGAKKAFGDKKAFGEKKSFGDKPFAGKGKDGAKSYGAGGDRGGAKPFKSKKPRRDDRG